MLSCMERLDGPSIYARAQGRSVQVRNRADWLIMPNGQKSEASKPLKRETDREAETGVWLALMPPSIARNDSIWVTWYCETCRISALQGVPRAKQRPGSKHHGFKLIELLTTQSLDAGL